MTPTDQDALQELQEEAQASRLRKPIDILAEAYGGPTRAERRAFKSRFKRLVRQEARKKLRERGDRQAE